MLERRSPIVGNGVGVVTDVDTEVQTVVRRRAHTTCATRECEPDLTTEAAERIHLLQEIGDVEFLGFVLEHDRASGSGRLPARSVRVA
jgi:hypothetical protein